MKTVTIAVYQFSELSEEAKQKARDDIRSSGFDIYGWSGECLESINAFCSHFGVKLVDYEIGPWSAINYKTDAQNSHFRGVKLSSIDREFMPTGYCGDNELWHAFYDAFKATGDAKQAFDDAIYAGFKAWRDDWEFTYSDEAIDDYLTANEYQFTEDGKIY